ncbi:MULTISPECIES: DUF1214 domain-containing protein [Mycobacteriaceae]|uniref:DUF1214 domain-containing protein n=1 Tax=Mycolicibacterium novocastrense TaxID=59813 RepID=A0AAW5SUS4_MYCNV|nr:MULTISPECIES: DUF1214 domain-containing protein [Mycobacteriaceae]MCV7027315.1 DUF1214 domain-containing protein [Mycolicibacterium novocastrense]OBB71761.1 hypothetical protein A5759_21795 [Mycobacterium sp. 852014-52144_SCH5372336]UUO03337.1 DUF1214 domain-containing protein [Mycolicibacterium novocastrense]GAT07098.1 uncharacterized protein RMCN_0231 [Mycolicibacterium novocastrense]
MAFGDGADDATLKAAWDEFCDRLKTAGERVFKDHNPASAAHRVDGFRFLTQNLGQAFDLALETRDTRYPLLHTFCHPTRKLGGDCADFTYQQAWIDGQSTYRITGERGTARFFNITVQGPRPDRPGVLHEPFGDVPEVNLLDHQLETASDGTFEIHIGGPPRDRNWLPTTPGSRKLFIRQGFDSWDERPARMWIERVDMNAPKPLPGTAVMTAAIDWAGQFLTAMMDDWPEFPFAHGGVDADRSNRFPDIDATGADAKRGRAAVNMHWELAADDALILEFDAHEGLWMLTNMGAFFTSMDFLYRPVSYTPSRTAVDADGKIRIVLCHDDPGYHNWMDTQGFERGNVTYRHMLEGAPVQLHTRLVKRTELATVLPPDTATVTPAERTARMWERFRGVRQRYGC